MHNSNMFKRWATVAAGVVLACFAAEASPAHALEPAVLARAEEAVERVNFYRRLSGLQPVTLDLALSEGCVSHAKYLDLNRDQIAAGLSAHDEYPDRPGYTPEGEMAGHSSIIAFSGGGSEPVDVWYESYYHRTPLMVPTLQRIGYGDQPTRDLHIAVLQNVLPQGLLYGDTVAPAADSRGQATAPRTGEIPSPFPGFGPGNGIPIVAYFSGAEVSWTASTISSNDGELEHVVIAPNRPSQPSVEANEICLITKAPLTKDSLIRVNIEYTQGGVAKKREWGFWTSRDGLFDLAAAEAGGPPVLMMDERPVIDADERNTGCTAVGGAHAAHGAAGPLVLLLGWMFLRSRRGRDRAQRVGAR